MIKNTADQIVSFQLISATDGSNVTSATPKVYVTGDGGAQAERTTGINHEGNGCWSFVVSAADSNYSHVSYTIVASGAISQTVNVYPVVLNDYKADVSALATSAALATSDGKIDAIKTKTDSLNFTVAGDVDCNVQTWKGSTAPDNTGDAYARIGSTGSALISLAQASVCTETRLSELNNTTVGSTAWYSAVNGGRLLDIQGRIPSTLITGQMNSFVGSIGTDVITSTSLAASAVTEIQNGLATPTNITAGTITTVTNLTNAPTNGDLTATMKASVNTEVDTALTEYGGSTHSAADVKTALEADNSDLDYLVTDLINKKEIVILDGATKQYTDAGVLIGTIATAYSDDGTTVTRKAMRQVK